MLTPSEGVKLILFLFLFKVVSTQELAENGREKPFLSQGFQDSSSRCGDTLFASIGTISYKNFNSYLPRERCVWTIRAPNATSYSVYVDSLGKSGSLLISGFGLRDLAVHSAPTAAANISVANSNVLVITFFTSEANNTENHKGFSLRYEALLSGSNEKAASTSEDVILPANAGHVKYPSNNSTYGNGELSLIIVAPIGGVYNPAKETQVIYIRSGLEEQSCQDRISVYTFAITDNANTHWKLMGRMCGGVDSELISSRDIIMFKFESDASVVSSGFHLYARSADM